MSKQVKIYEVIVIEKLIATHDSMEEAEKFLGLPGGSMHNMIKRKSINKSNKLSLIITCK